MVPEVGIPSFRELVLSEVEGGQAHRHGVEAPRDFETIQPKLCPPLKLNKSFELQTLMSSLKLTESWLLLGFCDVIFLPWAQLRAQTELPISLDLVNFNIFVFSILPYWILMAVLH